MTEQMLLSKMHSYLRVLFFCTTNTLSDDYYVNAAGPSRILHIIFMLSIQPRALATVVFFLIVLPDSEEKIATKTSNTDKASLVGKMNQPTISEAVVTIVSYTMNRPNNSLAKSIEQYVNCVLATMA